MKISEIFYSIQGEGRIAGIPSTFIRLAGCPLRCKWCDTKYAWNYDAGNDYSIDQILRIVKTHNSEFTVITGGEPMLSAPNQVNCELVNLVRQLKKLRKHITIETAGIAYIPSLPCDLMSISPKLSNSTPDDTRLTAKHEISRFKLKALINLIKNYNHQLKFVVNSQNDLTEIKDILKQLPKVDSTRIFLMPQAQNRKQLLDKAHMVADLCKRTGFAYGPRLHILLWQGQRAK